MSRSLAAMGDIFFHFRVAAAIVILFVVSGISLLRAEEGHPYCIGKITILQRQVFSESDSSLLQTVGNLANSFHVLTDEDVVRRELLFKEGDPYDQRLVDESARHLRRLGIIGDIEIRTDTLPDNTINIQVYTHDRWTLHPQMSVREGGGVSGFGLSVREENFLGTAQKLNVGYNRLSGRTNPNGGEIAFTEPRLLGSWWSASAQYTNSDDHRQGSIDVGHPFYADTATWAAQGYVDNGRLRILQFDGGLVTREDYLNQENERVWFATSSGSDTKLQLAAAYVRTRTSADSFQVRSFDNVDLVIGSVSVLHRGYYKASHLDNFGRVEDVAVGYQAGLAFGRNLHLSHLGGDDYFVRLFGQGNLAEEGKSFTSYQASVTSYVIGGNLDETTVSATALHNWKLTPNQTLIGRVTTTIGSHWGPLDQLTLGSFSGLRGYRNYEFSGQRILLMNVEHRMFSAVNLWFLKLGGALFFDSGAVWNMGQGLIGQRFHSDVGLGVRIESGKNVGSGIFRFDVAYNLDQRRVALILSSDHLFRAFSDLDFTPPVPAPQQSTRGG